MTTFRIYIDGAGIDGREFASLEDAVRAVGRYMGWEEPPVYWGPFTTTARDEERDAWCVYKTQEECDADHDGSRAPRVLEVPIGEE